MVDPSRARWAVVGGALGLLLSSCADHAATSPPDAAVFVDLGANDLGPTVDARTDAPPADDTTADVPPRTDVPVDAGFRLEVRIDPMGVPPPGSECSSDASVRPGDPTIAPPRPILPQSVSRVTSQRPSFRWVLPPGTTGARVEVCADRCCTRVITTLDAEGTTVRPPAALPPGMVYWRMFGRTGGQTGSRASYTWEFEVRRRDTPVDSSWGTIRDFTGDGYDDMVLFAGRPDSRTNADLYLIEGSAGGPRSPRAGGVVPMASKPWTRLGDFNGDGLADLVTPEPSPLPNRALTIVAGHSAALVVARRLDVSLDPRAFFGNPTVTDWNGDGYSDLVVSIYWQGDREVLRSVLVVYHGSGEGLGAVPQEMEGLNSAPFRAWVNSYCEMGDVDNDGYGDVYASDREYRFGGDMTKFIFYGHQGGTLRFEVIPAPPARLAPERYTGTIDLTPIGDLDGDGRGDFVAFPWSSQNLLLYRNALGFSAPSTSLWSPGYLSGAVRGGAYGSNTAGGDLNGDGFADLLVSAYDAYTETWMGTEFPFNSGRVYVYWGGFDGAVESPIWFDRARPTDPNDNPSLFGGDFASPGDLDGDGIDDLAIRDVGRGQVCFVRGSTLLSSMHFSGCPIHPGGWAFML